MSNPRPLHRLFDLSWSDYVQGTAITMESEMDLSLKQQFLDLVLIRKSSEPIPKRMPDGFEDLAVHNLVTFKSHQETFDGWALCELIGHYVNYRKQASPSLHDLLPESDFRLFAVCARYPQKLAQQIMLRAIREGVYEWQLATMPIRIIVLNQLPREEHNAMLLLFSAREDLLRYAREHYRPHSPETSTLLYELFKTYSEDPAMSEKLKEFVRESIDQLLKSLPPEERLKGLPPEEFRKRLSPEERLKGLSADEVVKALPPEVLEELARRLKANGPAPKQP